MTYAAIARVRVVFGTVGYTLGVTTHRKGSPMSERKINGKKSAQAEAKGHETSLPIPGRPGEATPAAIDNPKADIAALNNLERHLFAHNYASACIGSFSTTIDPVKSLGDSAEVLSILDQENHELLCSTSTGDMLQRLSKHHELLTPVQQHQVRILQRDRNKLIGIPASDQAAFTRLTAESYDVWRRAKAADDWASFEPYLDRIVISTRTLAEFKRPGADAYDVWLDEFEHGASTAFYDEFFAQVKDVVVPLLADVIACGRQQSRQPISGKYDAQRQWALARDLMELEGLDKEAMLLLETEHPFTDSPSTNYGIIASHVYEDDVLSNVFSMLHEGGHALYETNVDPMYNQTSLKGGTSSGMHEAQSRFFENYVGRNESFAPHLLEVLRKHFPGPTGRLTARQLFLVINRVEPSLIRTEADELTYPLHILIRYEIERLLMSGEATASDIPRLWADRYKSYLGIRVPNNAQGALQDVHWAQGLFGYFPTYAFGSAIGAQLCAAMVRQGIDFDGLLADGNLTPIKEWLRINIWQHGRTKDSEQIIQDACGEPFSATYFTDYLVDKYSAIYGL